MDFAAIKNCRANDPSLKQMDNADDAATPGQRRRFDAEKILPPFRHIQRNPAIRVSPCATVLVASKPSVPLLSDQNEGLSKEMSDQIDGLATGVFMDVF